MNLVLALWGELCHKREAPRRVESPKGTYRKRAASDTLFFCHI